MSDRNRLSAGDYLVPLPEGIQITLEYDDQGVIKKIFRGYESNEVLEDCSDMFLDPLISNKLIPNLIPLKHGATYIEGILNTSSECYDSGELPECIQDSLQSMFLKDPNSFKFFAISVRSLTAMFRGSIAVRQWLNFVKFNLPPGYLIPAKLEGTDDSYLTKLEDLIGGSKYTFNYPRIPEYVIFHNQNMLHGTFHIKQTSINKIEKIVNHSGVISAELDTDLGKIIVPYSSVVNFDLKKSSNILLDEYDNILYSNYSGRYKNKHASSRITCDFCGKIIDVPKTGVVTCSDPNCNSRLYPRIEQFLTTLKLPIISYDRYREITDNEGPGFSIPDILLIQEFEDADISVSPSDLLRAIVPMYVEPDSSHINRYCNSCKNSIHTIEYYLSHPEKIEFDLGEDIYRCSKHIVNWFVQYPENLVDFQTLLYDKKVNVDSQNKMFDGPQIFRNKNIMLTGTFYHGSVSDIESILKSYGGSVVSDFNNKVDCIIIGGLQERTDGSIIREGRNKRIPIFEEQQFFTQYDIESDMAENL